MATCTTVSFDKVTGIHTSLCSPFQHTVQIRQLCTSFLGCMGTDEALSYETSAWLPFLHCKEGMQGPLGADGSPPPEAQPTRYYLQKVS